MSRVAFCGAAGTILAALATMPVPAFAISHGCTPPTGDIKNISIAVSLDGRTSQSSGPFCSAIKQAEAIIARSGLSEERKKAAREMLMQLQRLVADQGRAAAGKKVSGSFGCQGSASTGSGGASASGGCGFQINF